MKNQKKIAALILAAGASERLGMPKQNLNIQGRTMLNHIKEQLSLDIVDQIFIVLGAHAEEIIAESKLKTPEYLVYENWQRGMGSSLAFACTQVLGNADYDGILITLSDLPLVDSKDYSKMCEMFHSKGEIIATHSSKALGVPALFGKEYFQQLQKLSGEKGAKSLLMEHKDKIKIYTNPRAGFDIDTPTQYREFVRSKK